MKKRNYKLVADYTNKGVLDKSGYTTVEKIIDDLKGIDTRAKKVLDFKGVQLASEALLLANFDLLFVKNLKVLLYEDDGNTMDIVTLLRSRIALSGCDGVEVDFICKLVLESTYCVDNYCLLPGEVKYFSDNLLSGSKDLKLHKLLLSGVVDGSLSAMEVVRLDVSECFGRLGSVKSVDKLIIVSKQLCSAITTKLLEFDESNLQRVIFVYNIGGIEVSEAIQDYLFEKLRSLSLDYASLNFVARFESGNDLVYEEKLNIAYKLYLNDYNLSRRLKVFKKLELGSYLKLYMFDREVVSSNYAKEKDIVSVVPAIYRGVEGDNIVVEYFNPHYFNNLYGLLANSSEDFTDLNLSNYTKVWGNTMLISVNEVGFNHLFCGSKYHILISDKCKEEYIYRDFNGDKFIKQSLNLTQFMEKILKQ